MIRYNIALKVFLLVLMTLSLSDATCEDVLERCTSYTSLCGNIIISTGCMKTCNACPPELCTVNNGGCEHLCNVTGGSIVCSCQKGFRLDADGRSCVDIDECSEGPNPCYLGLPAFCVNTIGSFSCEAYNCEEQGTMNYYRSGQCCNLRNSSCGVTATIKQRIERTREEPTSMRRVYGGRNAAMTAWPWQGQILYRGNHHCGATLITDRWMLGAAHCFAKYSYVSMIVYLGQTRSSDIVTLDSSRRVQRAIEQVIAHESATAFDDDIALIRLAAPVQFSDAISPICLPCGETPNIGDKCWVTGFGRTEQSGLDTSETLMEVDVPLVEQSACAQAYADEYTINNDMMLCAGYHDGGMDACTGDSGGPLACQRADSCEWYLSGVTSFGRGCGVAGYYGVYTNVVNYEAWIRENMGDDANDLCPNIYNPCRRLVNIDSECYTKLDRCESFPHYMNTNCNLACCQLRNNEISNCFDDPSAAAVCAMYQQQCSNPIFMSVLRTNCKKTCNLC